MKDMWILWDNSWSVGQSLFKDKIRPFLKGLIRSALLNVGPNGTHIGILTFSTQAQTRVLLELGELQAVDALINYLDSLNYNNISGDGTRTGMALKLADERFSKQSPRNYRPYVEDVVMIFTGSKPIRHRGEDTFGDKYNSTRYGEGLLAKDRAQSLKDNNIIVVGLVVGRENKLNKFRDNVKEWSTEGKYFETNKDSLQRSIMYRLIKSFMSVYCIAPVEKP
ncbi:Hypothetical predicted protein [Paramuricea clavata]|uniref:Uncharacterized protein n=1 Tax=Paramuricea clavata TaxID=317549 RepID=A0A6S7GU64_PARCT|nr:Hypothetical predicted protein [Paramuricea clavata]